MRNQLTRRCIRIEVRIAGRFTHLEQHRRRPYQQGHQGTRHRDRQDSSLSPERGDQGLDDVTKWERTYRVPYYVIVNPLMGSGNSSTTSNNMKLVHWPLMGALLHLAQRGGAWAGCGQAQSPPCCTRCNSPPINGQCTNHSVAV